MAIVVTPGYRFDQDEKLTPTKLNNLVDLATITNIPSDQIVGSGARPPVYGSVAPSLTRAQIWYDTTPGFEGLKYAFISASNASVAKWMYRTPHWDGIFWADSGATLGVPQVIFANSNQFGLFVQRFDGMMFPRIQPVWSSSTPTNGLLGAFVIPMESVTAGKPCVCAMMGYVPGVFNTNITSPSNVYASGFTPSSFDTFANGVPRAQSYVLGTSAAPAGAIPGVTLASWLFLGLMHMDLTP